MLKTYICFYQLPTLFYGIVKANHYKGLGSQFQEHLWAKPRRQPTPLSPHRPQTPWHLSTALVTLLSVLQTAASDSKVYSGIIHSSSLVSVLDVKLLVLYISLHLSFSTLPVTLFPSWMLMYHFMLASHVRSCTELFLVDSEFPFGFPP